MILYFYVLDSQIIISKLNLIIDEKHLCKVQEIDNPIIAAIVMCHKHPSIIKIRNMNVKKGFMFKKVTTKHVIKIIEGMKVEKSCQSTDIPTKIIKLNKQIIADFISENFNHCIDIGEFPTELKQADITPVFKKEDKSDKSNYRPVSILSNLSKIYEKLM